MSARRASGTRGSATVEQVGIVLLLSAVFAVLVAISLAGKDDPPGHGLGIRIANRIACGPREPGVCRQHPSVSAYGWDLARALQVELTRQDLYAIVQTSRGERLP